MKCDKAAGPSGIIAEMLKSAGEVGLELLTELTEVVFCNDVIPTDWQESFILNRYNGKGDALERRNYRSLKLTNKGYEVARGCAGLLHSRDGGH